MRRIAFVLAALGAVGASSAGIAVAASGGGPIVRTPERNIVIPNALFASTLRFEPGVVTVKSGGTITFVNSQKDEPHTATIVKQSELPRTPDQVENCKSCRLALAHLKDPRHPETSPVKTYVVNRGQPGFDARGDSVFITPGGPHKRAVVTVSAPAGTTLYYVCAIHPWMQGSITVTG
jgi:plastocyanin